MPYNNINFNIIFEIVSCNCSYLYQNEDEQRTANKTYEGTQYATEPIQIVFDLERPVHCIEKNPPTCQYSEQPALAAYPDNIQVRACSH